MMMILKCLMIWFMAAVLLTGCSGQEMEILSGETGDSLEGSGKVQTAGEEESAISQESIWVYVCGCVNCPGVYELPEGCRLFQAVEAAGGLTGEAASDSVNLAELVSDGQKIYIPSMEEAQDSVLDGTEGEQDVSDGRIHLNTATEAELLTLPGIGPSKAAGIIRYREENGGFSSPEELMEVPGIKSATYEQIKDLVTID